MRIIPASLPPVAKVAVWPSLLCGDASDCPPSRLAGREKLGSAVVTFEPTQITAWANVVGPPRSPGSLARPQPIAWVIRVGT